MIISSLIKSRAVVALPAMLLALAAGGCGSHGSAGSTGSAAPTASPAAAPTRYLGIERLDKAYVAALKKNVLVVTLTPMARGTDPNGVAAGVYDSIKTSLEQSNFDLAVVKLPMMQTSSASSYSITVYARDSHGKWARDDDPAVIEAIDRAGI